MSNPGWKCCKPRVLTFEEFLAIPPCTTGKHSTVDDTPAELQDNKQTTKDQREGTTLPDRSVSQSQQQQQNQASASLSQAINVPRPIAATPTVSNNAVPAPPEESESDDPSLEIPASATCRRRGCNATYDASKPRDEETCVHHPGQPIFHEGSKGWSCCKRRVLEFDQFLKIQGCKEKKRHLFVGKGKPAGEEKVESVRYVYLRRGCCIADRLPDNLPACPTLLQRCLFLTDDPCFLETTFIRPRRPSTSRCTSRRSTRKRPKWNSRQRLPLSIYQPRTTSGSEKRTTCLRRLIQKSHISGCSVRSLK